MSSKFKYRIQLPEFPQLGNGNACVSYQDFPYSGELATHGIWVTRNRIREFKDFIKSCKSFKIVHSYDIYHPTEMFNFKSKIVRGVEFRFTSESDAAMFKLKFL